MTQVDKRIRWKSCFDHWKTSGLSVAAWCREQDVKVHQMYYWVQKFENNDVVPEKETPETSWLPVQVKNSPDINAGENPVFIHFDSISVEVPPGANRSVLANVVDLLRKPC